MNAVAVSIIAMVLLGATNASHRIDQIVAATTGGPVWLNGIFPDIKLPELTPIGDVVAKVLKMSGMAETNYKIMDVETVRIRGGPDDVYFAVLLKTDVGDRVVLLQHSGNSPGSWWSRILTPPA
jgi:hypothetical protein